MSPRQRNRGKSITRAKPPETSRRGLILGLLLVPLTLAIYLQVCWFEIVDLDDSLCVSTNAVVGRGLTFAGWRWAWQTFYFANWMPLTWLSYMADVTVFGRSPGGHHVTNLVLHTASVLLVFVAFRRMTSNDFGSAFVAALFAVHPLHVESVAWIAERKGLLSMLFGLLSLNLYIAYARRPRFRTLAVSWVCFVCSLLSKQALVVLPFIFVLLDFWPLERLRRNANGEPIIGFSARRFGQLVLEKSAFFVASAAFSVIAMIAQSKGGGVVSTIPLTIRGLNIIWSYGACLGRSILPFNLAPFYPYAGTAVSTTGVLISLLIVVGITVWTIRAADSRPYLLVGWFWFVGSLVPTIGIVQIGYQQMADRYTYFPLLGLYLASTWLVSSLVSNPRARRRGLPVLAGVTLVYFGGIAFVQAGYWHDGITLFEHDQAVTKDNFIARRGLGSALFRSDRFDEALVQLQEAIRLKPDDAQAHYGLGRDLNALGRSEEAAKEYRVALAIEETYPDAHNDLGLSLFAQRKFADAKRHLERAIEINPEYANAYGNLGILYGELGDAERSIAFSQKALELDPEAIGCHRNLAVVLASVGRWDEAIDHMRYLLSLSPSDKEIRAELARLQARKPAGIRGATRAA